MVITNDPKIAETIEILRQHGSKTRYYHLIPGFNSRLDTIQSAILSAKLKYLDDWNELRRSKASLYQQLISVINGIEPPYIEKHNEPSWNYYTIRLKDSHLNRDELRKYLDSKGIQSAVYYPLSLHLQEVYRSLGYQLGDFPESELAQEQVLSLPMYPEISEKHIEEVVEEITNFING
jgi:dTDP-4-amino-4,6-dideoxygalactose transaminase